MSAEQRHTKQEEWTGSLSVKSTRVGVFALTFFLIATAITLGDPLFSPQRSTIELVGEALDRESDARDHKRNALAAAHPRAKEFPGAIPPESPRVQKKFDLDLSKPGWRSTGLYAPPGEPIRVSSDTQDIAKARLKVRIGCHRDWLRDSRKRQPQITTATAWIESTVTTSNPFGGLIYIEAPGNTEIPSISFSIDGGVMAPHYILGKTRPSAWKQTIRNHPAPWAELETEKIVLTVPSAVIRKLDDPERLMRFWDQVLDAQATLARIDLVRTLPQRVVADIQISAGYMHAGYPIMIQLRSAKELVNLEHLQQNGHGDVWGFYHELGHNHQSRDWTFSGSGEVTCNLFTVYCMEKLCGCKNPRRELTKAYRLKSIQRYVSNGADFNTWKRDPFLALQMYLQLKEAFGWESYQKVFAEYRALSPADRPRSDEEKRDQWLVRYSRTVGKNLGPFFEAWGVPTSQSARQSIADLPDWMPDDFPK